MIEYRRDFRKNGVLCGRLFGVLLMAALPAWTAEGSKPIQVAAALTEMPLEDLMNLPVTSVSKKTEKRSEAPAAIYVISSEDIRRSGVTSIPEALRLAPGVQVGRINGNRWAITIRGFDGLYAQKLLVLIDGRSVYTPLFAGVNWEAQDTVLEDIDRIEIIRGPGASLWGANAVNGVINIITKKAKDTQGGLLSAGAGSQENGSGTLRYGAKAGENTYWRVYTKYFDRDDYENAGGHNAGDGWHMLRGGFRVDADKSESDRLTLQGDIYGGSAGQELTVPRAFPPVMETVHDYYDLAGGNLLGRWTHTRSDSSEMALQAYYDQTYRDEVSLEEWRSTFDLDLQDRFTLGARHEFTWGLGYRYTTDDTEGTYVYSLNPRSRCDHLFSGFVQDRITLVEDRLSLTLGTKLEHNSYSGFEIQPSARLLWTPDDRQSIWLALSRAVQTPYRSATDVRINIARFPLGVLAILGNPDVKSEELLATELGYRVRATDRLYVDVAAFWNVYDRLRTTEMKFPVPEIFPLPPHLMIPLVYENEMQGDVYGVELAADWRAADRWRLGASYSLLRMDLRLESSSASTASEEAEARSPRHQFGLHSYLDLGRHLEFDTALYYVDALPALNVPSYVRADARLGWRPREDLDVSVGVQNAIDPSHTEFVSREGLSSSEIKREVYGKVTWRF